jgi:predicted dehydrogenase
MQSCCCNDGCGIEGEGYKWQNGMIVFDEPARVAGQESMLGFAAEPIPVVRVGFVGIGMRGSAAVQRFTHLQGVEVKGLCDLVQENIDKCQKMLTDAGMAAADGYTGEEDYKKLCERDDIDLIYVATDCTNHVKVALYAMEHGKHVAVEVPGAITLDECWALVDTSERTRRHCMMLENCVYDFFELTTLNMAQQGLFGEVLHVEGSYIHNLEEFWGEYWNNWRLDYNNEFRGDVYATHGLGPACQLLDIHRGDRMKTLVAMDTKAATGPMLAEKYGVSKDSINFQNGDHTMTIIRTENGKTIQIQHDVMNPRPYSRMYQLTGTNGFANKYPVEQYCLRPEQVKEGEVPNHENLNMHSAVSKEVKEALIKKYKHPIHQELEEIAKKVGGHGGMDFIMDYRLVYCLQNGLPLDMDVYDLAEWCSLAELGRISIENGNAPVEVPDFTRGGWNKVKGYRHAYVK